MNARPSEKPAGFHLILTVWGDEMTDCFLSTMLPSLLAPGNIPGLRRRAESLFHIVTPRENIDRFERSPTFLRLRNQIAVRFSPLPFAQPLPSNYALMNTGHRLAIRETPSTHAQIFLWPDGIISDGFLERVERLSDDGHRAIFILAPHCCTETILPVLERDSGSDGKLSVSPRQLVRLILDHLHPEYSGFCWNAKSKAFLPRAVHCWRVGSEGFFLRSFHLHPFMIFPDQPIPLPAISVDNDYLDWCMDRLSNCHIVSDSDEMQACSFTSRDAWRGLRRPRALPSRHLAAAIWGHRHSRPIHWKFFQHGIRLHTAELTKAWDEVESRSDRDLRAVLRWRKALREAVDFFSRHRLNTRLSGFPWSRAARG